jgi:hypothetical protein
VAKTTKTNGADTERSRTVLVDAVSNPDSNRQVNVQLHPALYDAYKLAIASKKGAGVDESGNRILKDGAVAETTREIIAAYASYSGALAITTAKVAGKVVKARGMVVSLFQALHDDGFERAKLVVKLALPSTGVDLTDDDLSALWEEAAS